MSKIYSLVSIDKSCTQCQYVNAISYSKELIEDMIQNIHPDDLTLADFIIKENTPIYFLMPLNDTIHIARPLHEVTFNKDNLYAFNKITTNAVENVLLDIGNFDIEELRKLYIFKDDISQNKIVFDTYYEAGIMNA
jgi:hypothetical protein